MLKELNKKIDTWWKNRVYEKKLAGRGPYVMYRCTHCRSAFFEIDIIGDEKSYNLKGERVYGGCPRCNRHDYIKAFPLSPLEYIGALIRILRGK
jgi:DNA-directed RNA polymerase subunit RPC12/RpoP